MDSATDLKYKDIMGAEIERKYLVQSRDFLEGCHGIAVRQGYVPTAENIVVRIRTAGEKAFLTLKGENRGIVRSEFEFEIPPSTAEEILVELCRKPIIEKTRFSLEHSGMVWTVDVFHCDNEGLVVAEVELETEDQSVELPPWVGEEVTGDPRYANSSLVEHPYKSWVGAG